MTERYLFFFSMILRITVISFPFVPNHQIKVNNFLAFNQNHASNNNKNENGNENVS